jgi:hypothetical protein
MQFASELTLPIINGRYFPRANEAIDIVEALLFAELMTFVALFTMIRFDGIPRSTAHAWIAAGSWAHCR